MLTIDEAHTQVERFLTDTQDARALSELCRDYFDHKQWTDDQVVKLNARGQAPVVVNRIRAKVEGLVGLYNMRKTDPKAYPRTQAHEDAAEVVTDGLRYVADNVDFDQTRLRVAESFFIEGYGGALVDVRQTPKGEIEIQISEVPWDRIYYDPHSRNLDFSDARYLGIVMWMDKGEAEEKFPEIDVEGLINAADYMEDETFEDRPRWVDRFHQRIRVALHFYIHKSKWHMGLFSGTEWVVKPQPSPFLDADGEPTCPLVLVSANVDRENNRYSEVRGFLDQQREINYRRSKFLHMNNTRQTFSRKGAVEDIAKLKREMSKADGHVEFPGEEFGKDFGIIPTGDMSRAQVDLYMDAKAELDAISFNAQLSGERQSGDLSGKAIDRLQQAGTIELNRQFALLSGWETRIYRQVWGRMKQFWTEEKWIRVTDDMDSLRWVGFNQPITLAQHLNEMQMDEASPLPMRQQAAMQLQMIAQQAPQMLEQMVETKNPVAEMDMDIIIDQSFEFVNVQQEQFQMLAQFAQGQDIDILELIELSEIRGKDELIEKIEKRRQAAAERAGGVQQAQAESMQLDNLVKQMDAAGKEQKAMQTKIENHLLMTQPERVTSVAV